MRQAAQKMVGLFEGGLRGETAESARCSRLAALESHDCKQRPCLKREKPGTEKEEEEEGIQKKELQSFSFTLQFYSSKAHDFVWKNLFLALRHLAQIRKWYNKVPAKPEYIGPAFDAFHAIVKYAREKCHEVVCSLMVDDMEL